MECDKTEKNLCDFSDKDAIAKYHPNHLKSQSNLNKFYKIQRLNNLSS